MERESLSKLNFILFLNWVEGVFISTHLTEEMVKLIIWLFHFSLSTIKCFNSSILNLNIKFIDRFNNLVTVGILHHILI